jgi:hypothetical protein
LRNSIKYISAAAIVLLSGALPRMVGAQAADANCNYERCALGLAPTWDGLSITRGESETRIANLGFFIPTDVSRVFQGNDAALDAARDAMDVRRVAAVLTDAGIVLLVTGVARGMFQRDFDNLSKVLAVTGGVSLGASVPLQFAADGLLSRAVWLYNRRFSR